MADHPLSPFAFATLTMGKETNNEELTGCPANGTLPSRMHRGSTDRLPRFGCDRWAGGGAQAVADDPRVMMASPEITNYTPPVAQWPLKPGDRVTPYDLQKIWTAFDDEWHRTALVWVVSESGPAGAIPFGAWFTSEHGLLPHRDPKTDPSHYHYMYRGHFPVKAFGNGVSSTFEKDIPLMEEALPPSLRGYVDPLDHIVTAEYKRWRTIRGS